MTSVKLTVGADPELFLTDIDGKFVSSIGLIGGSKRQPRPIGQECSVQEDNVAVEFNIPPCENADKFVRSCQYALDAIMNDVADKGLFINLAASTSFPAEQLKNPKAKVFGCDPDFNAWTEKRNPSPHADDPNLRSCGGHVHIGTPLNRIQIIRWCDIIMGLNSVLEDKDVERRKLYGQAGAHRPKKYGVEYRTLSNYWLASEELMRTIFHRTVEVTRMVYAGYTLEEEDGRDIQRAINTSDIKMANRLLNDYQDLYGCAY